MNRRKVNAAWMRARPFALAVALLLSAATLLAAAHCELGGMKRVTAHSCCAAPAEEGSAPDAYSDCCAVLAAPVPSQALAPVAHLFEIPPAFLPALVAWCVETGGDSSSVARSPGDSPPSAIPRFLETLLCREIPAHGPPSFVA